ncbi:MAG: hypothetical protein F6K19_46905, partial [Cyanothece sp. SIO1E1]|nr:hypothetical protein [Cyanothece sp. SIO1E1]
HLPPESDPTNTALNQDGDNPLDFVTPLAVGSHILTFTAKDQREDTLAALKAVEDAGMSGGPPKQGVEDPCVIHVLIATLLSPDPTVPNIRLARSNLVLKAQAPVHWGQEISPGNYAPNPEYHAPNVNRIQYHWRFTPVGPPAERPLLNLTPEVDELTFALEEPPSVEYRANLQGQLGTGRYQLTLNVEDKQNSQRRDQVSTVVVLT